VLTTFVIMPDSPDLLASDAERERAAETLRAHAADGRLDHDELEDRLGRAYGARTRGELAPLLADLPAPAPRAPSAPRRLPQVSPLIAISVLLIVVWALTGMDYFWPVWPIGAMALSGLKHRGRCVPASRYLRAR
jgi:hypothetical protein